MSSLDRPARRPPGQARHARPPRERSMPARRSATTRQSSVAAIAPADGPPARASRTGSGRRRSTRCWSSSRASMPPARTARSPRSWRHSTRRAARSRRSRCRPPEELGHDFLWRIHKRTPRKGEIGIFNRSHYEDVLVVRVHGSRPAKSVWSKRYDQINDFEGCWPRAARPSSSSSCRSTATSSASGSRSATTTRRSAGSSSWATSRSASSGTTTRPPSTTRCRRRRPRGAVVRHPGQPELVPQPGGGDDPGRHDGRPEAGLPAGAGPPAGPRHRVAGASNRSANSISQPATASPWPSISSGSRPVSARSQASDLQMQPRARASAAASRQLGRVARRRSRPRVDVAQPIEDRIVRASARCGGRSS